MNILINVIFWPLMFLAIATDGYANGFRTSMVFPSMATLLWMLGYCVALAGPLFGYFADDDWVVKSISVVITAASFGVSLLSGYGALGEERDTLAAQFERKGWLTAELAKEKYTEKGLDKCYKQASGRCVVNDVKADKKAYEEELKGLAGIDSPNLSHNEELLSKGIMVFLALSPLISLGCSLILAKVRPPIEKKKLNLAKPEPKDGSQGEKNGSHGSQPRNQEPENGNHDEFLLDLTKPEREPEQKTATKRKSQRNYRPTDKEHEELKNAYQEMKREGRKITQKDLGYEAKLSKGKAAHWLKHTDEETKMEGYRFPGNNIVPIGPLIKT